MLGNEKDGGGGWKKAVVGLGTFRGYCGGNGWRKKLLRFGALVECGGGGGCRWPPRKGKG